jgi:hypothetical protein
MKTKFPVMTTGAVAGALFILGATVGQAAAWDHRDGDSRYGGPGYGSWGDFHWDDHHHGHDRYRGRRNWYGPRWYGPPRYRGPELRLYVPPPVVFYPAYPVPVPPPVVQLSSCQQTVGNGLIERYGPGTLVFSGDAFEGTVTLDRQPFNYRCAGGQVNIW